VDTETFNNPLAEWVPVWKALNSYGNSAAAPGAHVHEYIVGELGRPLKGNHAGGALFAFGSREAAQRFMGGARWHRSIVAAAALGVRAVTKGEVVGCERCDWPHLINVPSGSVACEAIMVWE